MKTKEQLSLGQVDDWIVLPAPGGSPAPLETMACDESGRVYAALSSGLDKYLVRLIPAGDVDVAFGVNGVVRVPSTVSLAVMSIDHVINTTPLHVTIYCSVSYPRGEGRVTGVALFRFLDNGQPDPSFGVAGVAMFPQLPVRQADTKVCNATRKGHVNIKHPPASPDGLQTSRSPLIIPRSFFGGHTSRADGKITMVVHTGGAGRTTFYLVRVDDNGMLDSTYGAGQGYVILDFNTAGEQFKFAVDSTGRALIATDDTVATHVKCYGAEGAVDNTFGDQGVVSFFSSDSTLVSPVLSIDKDDRPVIGMTLRRAPVLTDSRGVVVRLTPAGELDPVFNSGQSVELELPFIYLETLHIEIDEVQRIVVLGTTLTAFHPTAPRCAVISRCGDDGLDISYEAGGHLVLPEVSGYVYHISIQRSIAILLHAAGLGVVDIQIARIPYS